MEQEEEENICDDVIYADPGRRSSRCRPKGGGGYLRGMHIEWGFLSGWLQLGGVISGGLISRGGGYLRRSQNIYYLCYLR